MVDGNIKILYYKNKFKKVELSKVNRMKKILLYIGFTIATLLMFSFSDMTMIIPVVIFPVKEFWDWWYGNFFFTFVPTTICFMLLANLLMKYGALATVRLFK